MLYCGICHSDCLSASAPGRRCQFPFIGGHELLGRVTEIGPLVTKFKVGDNVGVGCLVDSCLDCKSCKDGNENYCDKGGFTGTYNGVRTRHSRVRGHPESKTWGGYSGSHVVDERFVSKIPDSLPLEVASPLLCAGITTYMPIKDNGGCDGVKMTIGVIGIGGLGTMAIKIARALGHDVIAVSSSKAKEQMAKDKGATHFCVSKDPESIASFAGKVNILISTVSATHDMGLYLPLVAKSGVYVAIGLQF